jgi:hypothetical protein
VNSRLCSLAPDGRAALYWRPGSAQERDNGDNIGQASVWSEWHWTMVRLEGEFIMSKVIMYAAVAAMVVGPLFAQESKMSLGDGDSMFIRTDGSLHRLPTRISVADHDSAIAKGAEEVSRDLMLYRHGGKLYRVNCAYIGEWKEGYPGTGNCQ